LIKSILEAQGFEGPFLGWCGGIQILHDGTENYGNQSCQTCTLSAPKSVRQLTMSPIKMPYV